MNIKYNITITICLFITLFSCDKNDGDSEFFKLSSLAISSDSLLPLEYTCDGDSSTLALEWSGFPENTEYFVLIMHHEAAPDDIHYYWIVYNIPSEITSIAKNETGFGTLGTNSVNDKCMYAPPCSQGPGIKAYTYTVYALSEIVNLEVSPDLVTRDVILTAIKDITLAKATMTVYFSRF